MPETKATATSSSSTAKSAEAKAPLADAIDEDAGILGEQTDPTPNERYSLESDDWRTPETDRDTHADLHGEASAAAKFGEEA